MSLIVHVNGAAGVGIDTGSGLETLGWSESGVSFRDTLIKDEVRVDTYFKTAWDYQYSLTESEITCDLVVWDWAVLNLILARVPLNGVPGVFGPAGTLFVQQGHTFRLLIVSTPAGTGVTGVEPCRNYHSAFLDDAAEVKVGTERSIWRLKFRAMPYQQLSSSSGVVLWNNVCS